MVMLDDVESDGPNERDVILRVAEIRRRRVTQIHLQVFGRQRQQRRDDVSLKSSVTLQQVEQALKTGHSSRQVRAF